MAKKPNFAEEVPADLGGDEAPESYVPATRHTGALLNPNAGAELDMSGVRPPYLTITHGVGEAAETFNPGDLVLAKENLVCPKGKTLDVIILNVDQYLKQRVSNDDWNAGIRPDTFKTKEEAAAKGFQTEWVNGVGPDVSPAMDLVLLLRKPKDVVCGLFGIDIGDGEEYAICQFTADKTGYSYVLNDIAMIIKMKLKTTGVYSALWTMTSELSKPSKKGNRVQVARFKFKEMLKPDTVLAIVSVIGTPGNG